MFEELSNFSNAHTTCNLQEGKLDRKHSDTYSPLSWHVSLLFALCLLDGTTIRIRAFLTVWRKTGEPQSVSALQPVDEENLTMWSKRSIEQRMSCYGLDSHSTKSLLSPGLQGWAEGAVARQRARIRRGPERSSTRLTKTTAGLSEESQAACPRRGRQRRRGPPPARTAVCRRRQGGSRCVLCAEVKQQTSLSDSGTLTRNVHCTVGRALFWGSWGIWRCRRWQTTAGRGCIPEFQCCPIQKKKKKLN